ncbi:MAG: hypothetical protein Kow00108_06380 [Calditrichia bacterium]
MAKKGKIACPECGHHVESSVKFCPECGYAFKKVGASKKQKAGVAAGSRSYAWVVLAMVLAFMITAFYNFKLIDKATGKSTVEQQHNHDSQDPHASLPQLDEAKIKDLMDHIKRHPNEAAPVVELANYYFDNGRYQKAISYYEQALMLNDRLADVWVDKGVAYFNLQNYDQAIEDFKKALTVNPAHTKAMYNMGIVYHTKNEMNKVIEVWETLIKKAPGSPEAVQAMRFLDQIKNRNDG